MNTKTIINPNPLVSIVIPTFNAAQFIRETMQSVLAQTYQRYEIIVVDDGSTDNTKDILTEFKSLICLFQQENRGPSAARNAGIKAAKGEYICFLDADDLWPPEKLVVQLEFFESHPEIAFVSADHQDFSDDQVERPTFLEMKKKTFGEVLVTEVPLQDAFSKLIHENFISTPTVMMKKSSLDVTGLFDESLWSVEDRDLWLRVAASFNLACLPNVLCKRRVHQTNISLQSELTLFSRIKVIEKNWKHFPTLVPEKVWRNELAGLYCQLGYVLLKKGQRRGVLDAGLNSLMHAFCQITRPKAPLCMRYSWVLGIWLIPAALLGWEFSRIIFQPIKRLVRWWRKHWATKQKNSIQTHPS